MTKFIRGLEENRTVCRDNEKLEGRKIEDIRYINAHAGIRLTHPVLYNVGVYIDMPTICMLSDQNNCRLATHTTCNASCTAHTTDTHSGAPALGQ